MAQYVIMPKLGFNMDEGQLVKWHKKEGEYVEKGEILFEILTDKTNMEIEATASSYVKKLLVDEGEKVPVTLPIAIIGQLDENVDQMIEEAERDLGKKHHTIQTQRKTVPTEPEALPSIDYDVAVIGGGPGGYVAAIKAAQAGKKVCLVEKNKLGGVCLNQGCIPTKALIISINALKSLEQLSELGITDIDVSNAKIDMSKLQSRKNKVVEQLTDGVSTLLMLNGVEVLYGSATFVDKNTIKVGKDFITAQNIIIATGSSPAKISIPISDDSRVITSEEALDLTEVPPKVVIIGGGVIGMEFSYILRILGSEVTVIELLDHILPMVDEDISDEVLEMMKNNGLKIFTGAKVTRIEGSKVFFEKDGKEDLVDADKILISVGRIPNTYGLNLEAIGIAKNGRAIATDKYMKTNIPNVYAIGDANGISMLAHTAMVEGIIAVENICGKNIKMDYTKIPSCIYLHPEVASVGLTEKQAIEKYGKVKVGKFPLSANGKSVVEGEPRGLIKVIAEPKYNEILVKQSGNMSRTIF
jgi:dihydrolipoamide dehydrogenase